MINKIMEVEPKYKEMTSSKEGKIEISVETFEELDFTFPAATKKIDIPNILDNLGK